jgi:alpha-ribazole phosphatase
VNGGGATELILIRHAPAQNGGRLCGRTDVAADLSGAYLARLASILPAPSRLISSPARRCRETAAALWPGSAMELDDRLWEQDFGTWEDRPYADLPDLGPLSPGDLAGHRPPGGESFADLCARAAPALAACGAATVVAHAGTVRAALVLALGAIPAALAFEVAPLSVTRLVRMTEGRWSIRAVNWTGE